jgi:1,2-diacylglycerol 3-alpha-glucosyltransferase
MRILMMTNTYTPVVGGMEESIRAFTDRFRERGHKVMIVAPEFENMLQREEGVVRIPAIQKFNRSDFSVNLPIPGLLPKLMHAFKPDIVHSHHPFLIGDIALRLSGQYSIPLIFTYHTMFEEYLHYLPFHNEVVKRFVIELAAGYASLTDQVVVPSESIRKILLERGVEAPINVVPTGVDADHFAKGKGRKIRDQYGIPQNAFVVGLVGRLAAEKNLEFLATAVSAFMNARESAHFLIVGKGPFENTIKSIFINAGLEKRVHFTGLLRNQELIDSYHAMDIFAFSSHSETQGLVITEASAAGIPIVAIDAPGVREVVKDGKNGRLIYEQDQSKFVSALSWCADQDSTVLLKRSTTYSQKFLN